MISKIQASKKLKEIGARDCGLHFRELVLCGFRGALLRGDVLQRQPTEADRYDDVLTAAGPDGSAFFPASLDPGRHAIETRSGGAARLEPGVYTYVVGTHPDFTPDGKKNFPALNQFGAVTIRRDVDRDWRWEESEPVQSGVFLISIHWGFGDLTRVGKSSAGCTVLQSHRLGSGWQSFWTLVMQAARKGQKKFRYWVLTEQQTQELFR